MAGLTDRGHRSPRDRTPLCSRLLNRAGDAQTPKAIDHG
jgi:hypothetical protein